MINIVESKEERPEESKEEGSENKICDNGKPEDNQPASVEAAASHEVSVELNNEVNTTSPSQKEADESSKETNDALAQKEVENQSKVVDDDGSQKEDDNENKEASAGDESKEEVGDGSKEVNGGSSVKEVDDTQSTSRKIEVPSSKVGSIYFPF